MEEELIIERAKAVFKSSPPEATSIHPPEQVFINQQFNFLITIGGHLAEGETEFDALMSVLKKLGEIEFYVVENSNRDAGIEIKSFWASEFIKYERFAVKFSIDTPFQLFDEKVKAYDPPFGFFDKDFYVFGQNPNWGIYICECPTTIIIGCTEDLVTDFAAVYKITETGFEEQEHFIENEYRGHPELKQVLVENYKLIK